MSLSEALVQRAAVALSAGEVVGLPTDTVYGLGVLAARPGALAKLFALKGRPDSVAVAVLVDGLEQALGLAEDPTGALRRLGEGFWPGALTVVCRRRPGLALHLGGDEATIGLRAPDDDFVGRLCALLGPLAVTSANHHGEAPLTDAASLTLAFPQITVIDGGPRSATPSTVVSIVSGEAVVLREGAIGLGALEEALGGCPPTKPQ